MQSFSRNTGVKKYEPVVETIYEMSSSGELRINEVIDNFYSRRYNYSIKYGNPKTLKEDLKNIHRNRLRKLVRRRESGTD
jgi:hypothetical protein